MIFDVDPEARKAKRTRKWVREYRAAMENIVAALKPDEDGWLPPCTAMKRNGKMLPKKDGYRKRKKAS